VSVMSWLNSLPTPYVAKFLVIEGLDLGTKFYHLHLFVCCYPTLTVDVDFWVYHYHKLQYAPANFVGFCNPTK
jgi:hypothetical protein